MDVSSPVDWHNCDLGLHQLFLFFQRQFFSFSPQAAHGSACGGHGDEDVSCGHSGFPACLFVHAGLGASASCAQSCCHPAAQVCAGASVALCLCRGVCVCVSGQHCFLSGCPGVMHLFKAMGQLVLCLSGL